MLARGRLIYYGPPGEAASYFGVQRISEIYDRIAQRDLDEWQALYRKSDLHRDFVERRLGTEAAAAAPDPSSGRLVLPAPDGTGPSAVLTAAEAPRRVRPQRPPLWHQFRVSRG